MKRHNEHPEHWMQRHRHILFYAYRIKNILSTAFILALVLFAVIIAAVWQ